MWTDDDRPIATARLSDRGADIIALPADGSSSPKVWGQSDSDSAVPSAWSASAKTLLVTERRSPTQNDVLAYLANGGQPTIVLDSNSSEISPAFSPDGRFIAYGSDESGRLEIYVRPCRDRGSRTQISTGGGVEPVWARDGSALFFRNSSDLLMVTTQADAGGTFSSVSRPVVLFSMRFPPGSMLLPNFDVAADGQRSLIMRGRQWAEGAGGCHPELTFGMEAPWKWRYVQPLKMAAYGAAQSPVRYCIG